MPNRCSVFGCRSNYDTETERTTVFSLPTDANRRKLWLRHIPTDFSKLKQPGVCIKHFDESFIIRIDRIMDKGEMKEFPRIRPKLTENAVPTIFPNAPAYCSKSVTKVKRLSDVENDQLTKAIQASITSHKEYIEQDSLRGQNDILSHLEKRKVSTNKWCVMKDGDRLHVCLLGVCSSIPHVISFITVNSDLTYSVNVNSGNSVVKTLSENTNQLNSVNTLDSLMSEIEKGKFEPTVKNKLDCAIQCLEAVSGYDENEHLKFVVEQLKVSQVTKNNRRYGNKTMIIASCLYVHSSSAYNALRTCNLMFLPHPRTLQNLICNYQLVKPSLDTSIPYLKNRIQYLKPHELLVSVVMDEIYIQPKLSFKSGEIYGSNLFDAETCAKTAQVFMVSSVLSKYVDVVAIFPVANMTGEQLKSLASNVLCMLEQIGFTVVTLIADNNSVNRKAYELFSANKILQPSIEHPLDPSRKLFFMFDTVHILKCLRNNWETKRNVNKTLQFPDMKDHSKMLSAQYRHLELVFEKEKNSLVKYGHTLSSKVLYPSSIQKQNVKLALRIFNENNVVALKHATKDMPEVSEQIKQTVVFLQIIVHWWKICNVKNVFESQRFNDPSREAITATSCGQMQFLHDMCHWLKIWRLSVPPSAALSPQTFQSLILTTESFLQIVPYLFEKYRLGYILLGKFQSDNLESRFGSYRQLSGANYYISYVQVLENERKLRFKNDVLFAAQNTNIHLKTLIPVTQIQDHNTDLQLFSQILDLKFKLDDISGDTLPILTYIGGYTVKKVLQKSKCDTCTVWLQLNEEVEVDSSYDFIKDLNRGKLTLPSEEVVFTVGLVWHTVSELLSNFFQDFMTCGKQLSISHNLAVRRLKKIGFSDAKCKCLLHNSLLGKLEDVSLSTCRILINNFEKMTNDRGREGQNTSKKLKKMSICL